MQQHGFIHDMLDVKVLILFVASKALYPLSLQKIYELCFQDDCLSYFDVSVAVPQMVESGHLEKTGEDEYVITEDEHEIEQVVGRYVIESLLDEIGEVSDEEETWPCGENHRPGEFCYCGQNEYLQ